MQGVKKGKVILEQHNVDWEHEYEATKHILIQILGKNIIEIHHIGSTAIKGIVAKLILDVGVVVKSFDEINIKAMSDNGYAHCGEAGVPGRSLFALVDSEDKTIAKQYIHCYLQGHSNLIANIQFKDYLNKYPEYAQKYNDLKINLQKHYHDERKKYTDGKLEFVKMVDSLAKKEYGE